jgi:hypothetical protein
MPTDDTKSDGAAVVLNIKAESREADLVQKFLNDGGGIVEGIRKLCGIGHCGIAKPGVVRRHDMKPVRESPASDFDIDETMKESRGAERVLEI